MKSFSRKIILFSLSLTMIFSVTATVHAVTDSGQLQQGDYTLLAPLPGTTDNSTNVTNFQTYLPGIFVFAIGVATVMAFVMITWGGIQYMTTDAISGKANGRENIENALWGLGLCIAAWIILYTINPQILTFNLGLPQPSTAVNTGNTGVVAPGGRAADGTLLGYALTDAQVTENTVDVQSLKLAKVNVNAGPCTTAAVTTGCTDIVGLPSTALTGVVNLEKACSANASSECYITISGGAEGGHLDHGPGLPVMDLEENSNLSSYINKNGGTPVQTKLGPLYTATVSGETVTFLHESNPAHWHVVFK